MLINSIRRLRKFSLSLIFILIVLCIDLLLSPNNSEFFIRGIKGFYRRSPEPLKSSSVDEKLIQISDPILKCPEDYFLIEKKCTKVHEIDPMTKCPTGSIPRKTNGNECMIEGFTEPMAYCSNGFSFDPNYNDCFRTIIAKPKFSCPDGTTQLHGENKYHCVNIVILPTSINCPDNYSLITSGLSNIPECRSVEIVRPIVTCPKGYTLSGTECIQKIITKSLSNCSGDYPWQKSDQCVKLIKKSPIPSCPIGELTPDSKLCSYVKTNDPFLKCSHDYVLKENTCLKAYESPVIYNCPDKFKLSENNMCINIEYHQPSYECPPDTIKVDTSCLHTLETPHLYNCHKDGILIDNEFCQYKDSIKPTTICPDDYILKQNSCIMRIRFDSTVKCPVGSFKNNSCILETVMHPEKYCKDLSLQATSIDIHDDKCISTHRKSPQVSCEKNYILRDNKCVGTKQTRNFDYLCPPYFEKIKQKCVSSRLVEPIFSCPKGFYYDFHEKACLLELI